MHQIVHTEFTAEDPRALSHFYSQLFGWQCAPSDLDDTYVSWMSGSGDKQQGGGIKLGKTQIGPHGYIACFSDPAGNSVGLWSKPE
jgi:predicted enzyme related to lactoylglutathione lyase